MTSSTRKRSPPLPRIGRDVTSYPSSGRDVTALPRLGRRQLRRRSDTENDACTAAEVDRQQLGTVTTTRHARATPVVPLPRLGRRHAGGKLEFSRVLPRLGRRQLPLQLLEDDCGTGTGELDLLQRIMCRFQDASATEMQSKRAMPLPRIGRNVVEKLS